MNQDIYNCTISFRLASSFRPTSLRPRLFVQRLFVLYFFGPSSFHPMISKKYQELLVIIYIIPEIELLFLYTIQYPGSDLSYFYYFFYNWICIC